MAREHGEGGTFVETVGLDDVLGVFDEVEGPVVLSADVADQLDCSRETARRKLEALYDRGDLARRKVSRRVIYWLPEEERDVEVTAETEGSDAVDETPIETPPETLSDDSGVSERDWSDSTPDAEESDPELLEAVRDYLSDRPPRTSHGTDAVLDVFQLLRTNGTMKTGELKDEIHSKYADHYASKRAMWESVSRYLDDVPGIEKGGYGEWTYAGDDVVRDALEDDMGDIYDPSEEFQ